MRLVGACIEMLSSGEVVEQCQGKDFRNRDCDVCRGMLTQSQKQSKY